MSRFDAVSHCSTLNSGAKADVVPLAGKALSLSSWTNLADILIYNSELKRHKNKDTRYKGKPSESNAFLCW